MISIMNLRGYTAHDPLDRAPGAMPAVLTMIAVAVVAAAYLYLETHILKLMTLQSPWVFWVGCAACALIFAPLFAALRKSSSLLFVLTILLIFVPIDIYLQSNFRDQGLIALWRYNDGTFLSALPTLLQFLLTFFIAGLFVGPLALWISRLAAKLIYRADRLPPQPTLDQQNALFPQEWIAEGVAKPKRGLEFWTLRLLGIAYLGYLIFVIIGVLGASPWPEQAQMLIVMTYENPGLAMNTFSKISLMVLLAFIGAYNPQVRWHATLGLLVGHLASTIGSLGFYFYAAPGALYRDFLFTSAIVDGVMVIIFAAIMIHRRQQAHAFTKQKEFPAFYSPLARLSRIFLYSLAVFTLLVIPFALYWRLFTDGAHGWSAVYGFPDPQLGNTITKYTTLSLLAFLLAGREKLRDYFYSVLLAGFAITFLVSAPWLLLGDLLGEVLIKTRGGEWVSLDWYFMFHLTFDGIVFVLLIGLRKMYYNVEYVIASLNPSSARSVIALHDALYQGSHDIDATILRRIDHHVANIRGRKRGLLSFPFWLVEQVFNVVYGLHPSFSAMSREERRYFLRKSILRPPLERARSCAPEIAGFVYKIGTAVHALISLAHYSDRKGSAPIGYSLPDARDRLQGDYALAPPPFNQPAPLPINPRDPHNFARADTSALPGQTAAQPREYRLVAPRVVTPVSDGEIPQEVDYLIIGSGAGGAVMSFRLASAVPDPSNILVVERGPRFLPLQDFNDDEMEMVRKLYKEGGLQQTKRFDLICLQGECVGGTTVINNAICFEMPQKVHTLWQDDFKIDLAGLPAAYEQVAQELEIGPLTAAAINQRVKAKFEAGVSGYNAGVQQSEQLQVETLKANVRNLMGSGLCNLGNKRLRKRSMLETYVPWSEGLGVKIVGEMSAVRLLSEGGRKADAVMLRTNAGGLLRVKVNKAVIVAGGVIASSHFLMRSGVNHNVGQNMSCNFAIPLAFEFAERLDAFDGAQITMGAIDSQNRAIFETYFNPPGAFAISMPFYFDRHHALMNRYRNLLNFGALIGSEPNGRVEEKASFIDGRAFTWNLGKRDQANLKYALITLLKIGQAAGALRAAVPTEPGLEIELNGANVQRFARSIADYPLRMADLRMTTAHPQGGNRMCGSDSSYQATRVVDENFRVAGFDNVFVADASLFPTGITVNPQWTIMAMSTLASQKVLESAG